MSAILVDKTVRSAADQKRVVGDVLQDNLEPEEEYAAAAKRLTELASKNEKITHFLNFYILLSESL